LEILDDLPDVDASWSYGGEDELRDRDGRSAR